MQTVRLKIGVGVGVDAFFSNVGLRPAGLTQDDLSARHVLFYCWAQQKQEKNVFLTVIDRWSVVLVRVKRSLLEKINVMTSWFHKHIRKNPQNDLIRSFKNCPHVHLFVMCVYWKVEQMEQVNDASGVLETAGIFSNFQEFLLLNLLDN